MASRHIARLEWSRRDRLRDRLCESPVVHIAAPALSTGDFVAVAATLGIPEESPRIQFRVDGYSTVIRIGNERDAEGRRIAGSAVDFGWHSDGSYRVQPPDFTLLYALAVPARGGDTDFVSLYDLFDAIDPDVRTAWASYRAVHVTRSDYLAGALPDHRAVHPLIGHHPESGRPLGFISPAYTTGICGLEADAAARVLAHLSGPIESLKMTHHWQPHDLIAWDNRAAVHRATSHDPGERRCLWRTTVAGSGEAPGGGPS